MLIEILHHHLIVTLFLTGLFAGTVDAIAGGGGLISLPMLLSVGIPPHLALGTNKLQGLFGTASATYSYYKKGWLKNHNLLNGIVFSFIGAALGAIINQYLSSDLLKKIIPILLIVVFIYTLFSPKLGSENTKPKLSQTVFYILFGSLLGFYDGFFGPGVGSFWVFSFVLFLGCNLLQATAYTKALNFNTNVAAVIFFAIGNNIDYKLGLIMAVGQLLGGRIGAQLAIKKGVQLIRPVFLTVMITTIATLVWKSYAKTELLSIPFLVGILGVLMTVILVYVRNTLKRRNALAEK